MDMLQFSPPACALTCAPSASCQLFSTSCDFSILQPLLEGWLAFLLVQNLRQSEGLVLYVVNELATIVEVFKEFTQQQMEGCSGFVFSRDLR